MSWFSVCLFDITGIYILIFNNILGLFAARLLREYDIEVVLLEARDRTGGRTFTQTVRFHFMYVPYTTGDSYKLSRDGSSCP